MYQNPICIASRESTVIHQRNPRTLMGLLTSTRFLIGLLTSRRAKASRRGLRLLLLPLLTKSSVLLVLSGDEEATAAAKDRIDV